MSVDIESLKRRACDQIDSERDALIDLSARIHAHPECKFEETRAAAWLAEYLDGAGYDVQRSAFGLPTAVAARIGTTRPRVAILCEYDALPGIGHACGHNIIAAAGAGAARGLAAVLGDAGGSALVLGTPAEEGGGGKVLMAQAGAFDGVDAAMMVHPAGMELVSMGVLAVTSIEVEYRGRASHAAAAPERGINALDGLVTAYNAIAQLRQHIRRSERIHGIITDGGQAPNIVPERAAGVFYVRAATEKRLKELKLRVDRCFEAGALASGAEVRQRTLGEDYSDMLTNPALASAYRANLARLGRTAIEPENGRVPVTGSTDMGNVSKLVPSIHPMIAIAPPTVSLHSKEFAEFAASVSGNQAVIDGAKVLAMTAIDVLCQADLRAAMEASFRGEISVAEPS
jgi:amidohydrolase